MKVGIVAALAAAVLIAGCGESKTSTEPAGGKPAAPTPVSAEASHSGFYNVEALESNIKEGAEEQPGPGTVERVICVPTGKATFRCEMVLKAEGETKLESATVTVNPEGTHFVFSNRET